MPYLALSKLDYAEILYKYVPDVYKRQVKIRVIFFRQPHGQVKHGVHAIFPAVFQEFHVCAEKAGISFYLVLIQFPAGMVFQECLQFRNYFTIFLKKTAEPRADTDSVQCFCYFDIRGDGLQIYLFITGNRGKVIPVSYTHLTRFIFRYCRLLFSDYFPKEVFVPLLILLYLFSF